MQRSLAKGSGFLFPNVLEGREKGDVALTAVQMTTSPQAHLRAAGMEYKRYTIHSFRVEGAASHHMDGTAVDVVVEYVGWKSAAVARRYVGVTASAAAAGVKRSRETAFIEADALPLSEQFCTFVCGVPGGELKPNPLEAEAEVGGRIRTTRKPAKRIIDKCTTALRQLERGNKAGCGFMAQQIGVINPKLHTS